MTTQTVTLIAAGLAAFAAIVSLVVTTVATGRRERKAAARAAERERRDVHRNALEPHLSDLAGAIHEVVATSFVQQRNLSEGRTVAAANWKSRGSAAAGRLEPLRRRVRYFLPGLDPGFKSLIPLPSWVAHRGGGADADELLARADALAKHLHQAIEDSWRTGQPPPDLARARTLELADELRGVAPIGRVTETGTEEESLAEAPTTSA